MAEPSDKTNNQPGRSLAEREPAKPTAASGSGGGQDWTSFLMLMLATFLGSVVITLYVLGVNLFRAERQPTNVVGEAAIKAAQRLSLITIEHPSFGRVGLCDLAHLPSSTDMSSNVQVRVVGVQSLYQTLKTDEKIAHELKHPIILKLVKQDLDLAKKVESELVQRLRQAVEPDTMQTSTESGSLEATTGDQDNAIYRDIHRLVASEPLGPDSPVLEVHIKLGKIKHPVLITSHQIRLVDPDEFEAISNHDAPNLVLVEASYEGKAKDGSSGTVIKRACAVITTETPVRRPSTFLISFPDGVPRQFRSAADLLFCKSWPANGGWQQAVGSEVPGRGSLAPPLEPVLPEMTPGDAMAVALYHWLRDIGPQVDKERFHNLLNAKWKVETRPMYGQDQASIFFGRHDQEAGLPVNSCLVRDTGAREYAVMNQTGPGGIGQQALAHALGVFNSPALQLRQSVYPSSALPLLVDGEGKLNLSGRNGFNQDLVKGYLEDVYATNIAAIETLGSAQLLSRQSNSALSQIEQRVFIEKQELASLANRLGHTKQPSPDKSAPPPEGQSVDTPEHIAELTNQRMQTLKQQIESDEQQRKTYTKIQHLCVVATNNANRIASATYELCTHTFKLCREGLYRIDQPAHAYLIGKSYVFLPHVKPMTDSDFYAAAKKKEFDDAVMNANVAAVNNEFPWLSGKLDAVVNVERAFPSNTQIIVEGRSLKDVLEAKPLVQPAPAMMVSMASTELAPDNNNAPAAHCFNHYPFFNIPIPSGQLFYYCQNAALNTSVPKVSWSMVIRDLVATKSTTAGEVPTGEPIAAQEHDWCGEAGEQGCPGLACELQIRTPLPVLDQLAGDWYLTSPSANMRVPEIPPAPPDML